MGILIDQRTLAIVQGITGRQGSLQTELMLEYGTKIVAGVTPGRGGEKVHGVPVFETVDAALKRCSPDVSIIFVPAESALKAAVEAIECGVKTIIVITEGIPIKDSIQMMSCARHADAQIIGPNSPGVITPGSCKLGIMPQNVFKPGNIGVVSRSGTLTYEIAASLTRGCLGQSTCVGIGGDPIVGLNFIEALEMFEADSQTDVVVLIGEIGGNLEEITADFLGKKAYPKPIVAYIAGLSVPAEKKMGHAGAIIMGNAGTAQIKVAAFENVGVRVAKKPAEVFDLAKSALKK